MKVPFGPTFCGVLFAVAMVAGTPPLPGASLLTFEGLRQGEQVLNFYNGGTGSAGSSGTNFGVSFSANGFGFTSGNYAGEPSAPTVMFLTDGTSNTGRSISEILTVAAGFTSAASFFYTAIDAPASVSIFSDLVQDPGALLATLAMPTTPAIPAGKFSPFVFESLSFTGTARSLKFTGPDNQLALDNIQLGSVPEPSAFALFTIGVGCVLLAGKSHRNDAPIKRRAPGVNRPGPMSSRHPRRCRCTGQDGRRAAQPPTPRFDR
jgi:hypothetical protein